MQRTPKCNKCGKRFPIMQSDDGIPIMVGFQKDGKTINICKFCMMKLGRMKEAGKAEDFFKEMDNG